MGAAPLIQRCPLSGGKLRYGSSGSALHRAMDMLFRGKTPTNQVRAYFCVHCQGWHWTTKPQRKPR